ncbi:MAG: shikimate dehydrogenase [Alphaproteobacteria bacterium]|nr:shikimate dehydrogenase [Alphaproteobacteria bacterium]
MILKPACVIGFPIEHSKSPLIHNYWLKKHNIDSNYTKVLVEPENLSNFMKNIHDYSGINVTVPHKVSIIPYLDELTLTAKKAGAVNTVYIENGKVIGHNTDGIGFVNNYKSKSNLEVNTVTILGTGGASRGICSALKCKKLNIVYRTLEKAEKIKTDLEKYENIEICLIPWNEKEDVYFETDLLVNATTLGMTGFDNLITDLSNLKSDAIVADVVYKPLITDFLKQAEKLNHPIADGLGMLLGQAAPAFEKFFGILPTIDEDLRKLVI